MIVSRCLTFSRINPFGKERSLLNKKGNYLKDVFIRNGAQGQLYYREVPPLGDPPKIVLIVSSIAWWWVLWHCFTDLGTVAGIKYPNPEEWTDEELGIPED